MRPTRENGTCIVVLGDSITKGDDVAAEQRFTRLVEQELTDALGAAITVVNAGVNADITALAVQRLERDVLDLQPDYAVIMFGVNDAGFFRPETPETPAATPRVALADFRHHLQSMLRHVADNGITPILATPVPMSRYYWLADYRLTSSTASTIWWTSTRRP